MRSVKKHVFVYMNLRQKEGASNGTINIELRMLKTMMSKAEDGSKLRIHDLRHVFASWLHKEGVSLDVVRRHMGHKKRATIDRYTTVKSKDTQKTLDVLPTIRRRNSAKNTDETQ